MTEKRICFDLRVLQIGHEKRGIGMFLKSVLENLPENKKFSYIFYCFDDNNPLDELGINLKFNYKIVTTPRVQTVIERPSDIVNFLRLSNHRFKPLKPYKPDFFYQFDFNLGAPRWRKVKIVTIAYDLIPMIFKSKYMPGISESLRKTPGKKAKLKAAVRSLYYQFKYKKSYKVYRRSDEIIAISDYTKESFINLLGIDRKKIRTVHLAPVFNQKQKDDSILDRIKKPYFFYVGGADARKNIHHLVYALNIARGRGFEIDLVLAGNELSAAEKIPNEDARNAIMSSPYVKNIHLLGFITDEQKLSLYKNASAFVFASSFEGFGLPTIEAMNCGCPVISYDNSSIPEVVDRSGILVENGNYIKLAESLLTTKEQRDDIVKNGLKRAKNFNWPRTVDEILSIL